MATIFIWNENSENFQMGFLFRGYCKKYRLNLKRLK